MGGDIISAGYRPDIDGLRAISVLVVIGFHLGLTGFDGGFVGVDVFFVISGFVITRLMIKRIEDGEGLDLHVFFASRARRLLPALALVAALSSIAALALLTPEDLAAFGESVVASVLGVSNFLYWQESGYFDTAAHTKALLHTWSLGVEIQFYLLWPFVVPAFGRRGVRNKILVTAVLFAILSVISNVVFRDGFYLFSSLAESLPVTVPQGLSSALTKLHDGPATIFYLLPFRVFELMIGAAMAATEGRLPRSPALKLGAALAGLGAIVWSVVTFDQTLVYPAFYGLAPCLGAAAAIYGGNGGWLSPLLGNRALVWVGLVSYSLYLFHWPIIVFYRYATFEPLSPVDQSIVVIVSFACAFLSYRYVEFPARRAATVRKGGVIRRRRTAPVALGLIASLAISGAAMVVTDGLPSRVHAPRDVPEPDFGSCGLSHDDGCVLGTGDEPTAIWLGDSLTQHYIPALALRWSRFVGQSGSLAKVYSAG